MTSTVRRTSIYSLRVPSAFPDQVLPVLRDMLLRRDRPVLDQHTAREDGVTYAAVGFRAASDDEALTLAEDITLPPFRLVTGYGVHRREVRR